MRARGPDFVAEAVTGAGSGVGGLLLPLLVLEGAGGVETRVEAAGDLGFAVMCEVAVWAGAVGAVAAGGTGGGAKGKMLAMLMGEGRFAG